MKATKEEVDELHKELQQMANRLYEIVSRLTDEYTDVPTTCKHDGEITREGVIPGIPAEKSFQIMFRCSKCGMGTSLAGGNIASWSDEEVRRYFRRTTP